IEIPDEINDRIRRGRAQPRQRFLNEPALRLLFIGDFDPDADPYAAACRDAAAKLGLEKNVVFSGYSARVGDWYRACDVVALASQREGLPRCVIEAIACGAAIATFDVCSTREIVEAHGFGVVAAQGDYDGLAAGAAVLLSDPDRLADIHRRGPEFAAERFDPARNGALYAEFVGAAATLREGRGRRLA
ncbi:MAG: glycosyltransferase, partial [Pseudomonadota bacterium]